MNTILFDLDGTLLSMDHDAFEKLYFGSISNYVKDYVDSQIFIQAIQKAIYQTILDTSNRTIEDTFFDYFATLLGEDVVASLIPLFDQYYDELFIQAKAATASIIEMVEAVRLLKEKGYQVMVVTNPLFPQKAIDARIEWAGFNRNDFDYVTSFEANHYCKPNIALYEEVLTSTNKEAEHCMMVGNHCLEDMIASTIGMKTYLIEDEMIEHQRGLQANHQGTRKDFLLFCQQLPNLKN